MTKTLFEGNSSALFSPDRLFRYALFRNLKAEGKVVNLIGLNGSVADELKNDPTIRRGIGFAEAWGARLLVMTNIFGFAATDPREMKKAVDPIGPENDKVLRKWAEKSDIVVAAWGTHGAFKSRGREVIDLLADVSDLYTLGFTKHGHPKHPLYLAKSLVPVLWKAKR